jgi:D-glycero-D-manno-heptose 1,7-bisphosphate phosphatase
MNRALRKAVFVDKDGTLVENVPYNVDPALLRFESGALAALAALAAAGFSIAIVTNQSGLARGYFSLHAFEALRHFLQRRLREEAGVDVLGVYFCPHAPDASGVPTCTCRKPMPGLLYRAAAEHRLDMARSWMVGDTLDDVEAGRRAGCRSILYDSGGETVWRTAPLRLPNARVLSWDKVARTILDEADLGSP